MFIQGKIPEKTRFRRLYEPGKRSGQRCSRWITGRVIAPGGTCATGIASVAFWRPGEMQYEGDFALPPPYRPSAARWITAKRAIA